MMYPPWTPIRHSAISALPLAFARWTATPVYSDSGAAADLTTVRALAEQGSVRDEITLAGDYFTGTGVPRDPKMAAYWYEKAAGHGSPQAQNQIGYFYQAGIGVPSDAKRAFHWYQLAAAAGCVPAQVNLAIAYLRWLGVGKDENLALRFLADAFQKGSGTAG